MVNFNMDLNQMVIDRLKKINWFHNLGNPIKTAIKYDVSYTKSMKSAIKHMNSIRWENIGLEDENELTLYLTLNHKDKYGIVWNELVDEIKRNISPVILKSVMDCASKEKFEIPPELIEQITWDIISIIMAYTYEQYRTPNLYAEILKIYEEGNIPCGWNGVYPHGKIIIY